MEVFKPIQANRDENGQSFGDAKVEKIGSTKLDSVHQSIILFAGGSTEALKRFLVEDGAGNDTRFWTRAQVLSGPVPRRHRREALGGRRTGAEESSRILTTQKA